MQGSKAGCCTAAKQGPDAWCSAPAMKGSEGGRAGLCAAALGFEVGLRTGDGGVRGGVHLGAGVLSISDVSASSVFCMRFLPTSICRRIKGTLAPTVVVCFQLDLLNIIPGETITSANAGCAPGAP
ncbi:unnamed protein product [Miscanthus lutarioriparius]|uniref:Uncharacterized protein n=1 Tax=Miscanthus lutarioriparius TaxID=422564 RepID=A0A811SEC1_9POAL|nr:unnamed protein product [Miscanthus lutarioriparius]